MRAEAEAGASMGAAAGMNVDMNTDDEDQDQAQEQDTHDASSDEEVEVEAQETHKTPHAQPHPQQYSMTYQRALGLGGFMTPQAPPRGRAPGAGAGRYSVDGIRRATGMLTERETEREDGTFGGARRVRLETKWKVGDIVVPAEKDTSGRNKESEKTPLRGVGRVTEEERKAIQERRRSALKTPDTCFGGQAPGIRAAMLGSTPSKSATGGQARASPYKGHHKIGSGNNNNDNEGGKCGEGEEKEEDTKALLERMKETVEGMKRRRSGVPGGRISAVDVRDVRDGGVDVGMNVEEVGEEDREESDKENETEGDAMAVHEDAHAPSTNPPSGPHTPSFNNIRERSQNPSSDRPVIVEPKTPKMDGMRDLFGEKKVLATPAFEGVGEMMKTPRGWRMDVLEEGVDGEENGDEEKRKRSWQRVLGGEEVHPLPLLRRRRVPARAERLLDDEATPADVLGRVEEEGEERDKDKEGKGKKSAARKGRSKAPVVDSDAEEGGLGGEKVQKKVRLIRGSRKVVDDIPEEVQELREQPKSSRSRKARSEESEDVVEATKPPPTRKTKSAARSKAAAIITDDEGSSSKPARRTAKTAVSSVSASEDSVAPPAKLGRKTRTPKAVSESEPEPFVKTAPRKGRAGAKTTDDESAGAGAGTGKRGTRAKPAEVEEPEEDPLDSIDTPNEPPVTVAVTKGRRIARSRTATAETAKEEESEEEGTGTGKTTSVRKGTKVTGKKAAVAAAPATPGLAESEDGVDKENTPSVDDEDLPVKTKRATKAKKGVKAAVVAEETDGAVER